jgi:Fic family protein
MDKIVQLYEEWQSLQPLKADDQQRLNTKFKLEFNYNSNHIEGNTLTYGQTKLLFMFDQTSGNASLKDYEEMKAHNVGLEMMKEEAEDEERPLTESFIRELNRTILVQNYWKDAKTSEGKSTRMEVKVGEYKSRPNSVFTITGEIFNYASPQETPAFMTALGNWYNEEVGKGELSVIQLAAMLHYRYIRIHPFEDGNGRIARLLVNFVLHRHGYPMIVIHTEDKENYLRILHQCDVAVGVTPSDGANATLDKIKPFVEYLEARLIHALELSIKAAKGESVEEENDFEKQLSLLVREAKQKEDDEAKKKRFSEEEVRKVLKSVYFPLAEEFEKSMQLVYNEWFCTKYGGSSSLSKNDQGVEGLGISPDLKNVDNYLRNARSVWYRCKLESPKNKILGSLSINFTFHILFEKEVYHIADFCDQDYPYGEYPTEEAMSQIVSSFKQFLIRLIQDAIKK